MMYNKMMLKMLKKRNPLELSFEEQYQFLLDEKELENIYEIGEILGSPVKFSH